MLILKRLSSTLMMKFNWYSLLKTRRFKQLRTRELRKLIWRFINQLGTCQKLFLKALSMFKVNSLKKSLHQQTSSWFRRLFMNQESAYLSKKTLTTSHLFGRSWKMPLVKICQSSVFLFISMSQSAWFKRLQKSWSTKILWWEQTRRMIQLRE